MPLTEDGPIHVVEAVRLTVKPGDALFLRVSKQASVESMARMSQFVEKKLGVKCIVAPAEMLASVEVIEQG